MIRRMIISAAVELGLLQDGILPQLGGILPQSNQEKWTNEVRENPGQTQED
jgi:hypothetical protein